MLIGAEITCPQSWVSYPDALLPHPSPTSSHLVFFSHAHFSYQLFFLPSLTPLNSHSAACLLSHSVLKTPCYTKCQAFSCPPSQTSQCDAAKDLTARRGLPLTSLCFCNLTIDVSRLQLQKKYF